MQGFHAAVGVGNTDWFDNDIYTGSGPGTPILSAGPDGFLGGIHLGFNWQSGYWVYGVEGSFDYARLSSSDPSLDIPTQDTEINWLATVGPRVGYAMGNTLVYVEGGYAAADMETLTISGNDILQTEAGVHHGGFVGLGAEIQVTDAVTFGGEYNYVILGDKVHSGVVAGFGPISIQVNDVDIHTIAARISIKLDKLFGN